MPPAIKVGSKLTYLVGKIGGHLKAHLSPILVIVRLRTKQYSTGSKALIMPLTIWNYVWSYKQKLFFSKIGFYFMEINFTTEFSGSNFLLPTFSAGGKRDILLLASVNFEPCCDAKNVNCQFSYLLFKMHLLHTETNNSKSTQTFKNKKFLVIMFCHKVKQPYPKLQPNQITRLVG